MKKRIFSLFILELVVVLLLCIAWEFWLEDLPYIATILSQEHENLSQRLEYVITSFVFVFIALLFPYYRIVKSIATLENTRDALQKSLTEIKTLKKFLSICANCKKIRAENGSWHQLEDYIWEHAETKFSHGICPDCQQELYPIHTNPG
jgi:hypothetical protein